MARVSAGLGMGSACYAGPRRPPSSRHDAAADKARNRVANSAAGGLGLVSRSLRLWGGCPGLRRRRWRSWPQSGLSRCGLTGGCAGRLQAIHDGICMSIRIRVVKVPALASCQDRLLPSLAVSTIRPTLPANLRLMGSSSAKGMRQAAKSRRRSSPRHRRGGDGRRAFGRFRQFQASRAVDSRRCCRRRGRCRPSPPISCASCG